MNISLIVECVGVAAFSLVFLYILRENRNQVEEEEEIVLDKEAVEQQKRNQVLN
jgi:hypothetical protein